jgi:AcrR family transcriptional regulator
MAEKHPSRTQERILLAAEQLFAEHGCDGVSLRQITIAAEVNLAAVNYHFYDKESLLRTILTRRLQQTNERRLELLEMAEAQHATALIPLKEIFDALARPLLLPEQSPGPAGARLIGRILSDRQAFTDELLRQEFQPALNRFGQSLRRHVPGLPPSDFLWQFSFVVGALHHVLITLPDMPRYTSGLCQAGNGEIALRNFTFFACKAFSSMGS